MKYIRTKDDIYKVILVSPLDFVRIDKRDGTYPDVFEKDILKQSDTIEELFDEFVFDNLVWDKLEDVKFCIEKEHYTKIRGAIWTDKGLIYKAKVKGVLPNGEIDWELL